jgi:hypothetical protein
MKLTPSNRHEKMDIVLTYRPNFISALLLHDEHEVGHFDIDYTTNTVSMGIGIEDAYQKQGYSKKLIRKVCSNLQFPPDKKIYIDTDASEGFWDYLGLVKNPLYDFTEDQRDVEGAGYEKFITFGELTRV